MNLTNLVLTLESDGDTYQERLTICRRALTSGDKQRAYEEMTEVLQRFVKKTPQHFDREERQPNVVRAASELVVDGLCDELVADKDHWESLDDVADKKNGTPPTPGKAPISTSSQTALPSRKVPADVLGVLQRSRLESGKVYLPAQALDRKLYTSTKDVLVAMGGKWTGGKTQAFVFAEADPESFEVAFTGLLETGSYTDPKDMSFFPTPPELAAELVRLSGLVSGRTVLEPSAGRGAIALKAADIVGLANVKCFELYPPNARALERAGLSVVEQDFLAIEPPLLEADKFDVVLLNPPFSNHQDAAHVAHACRFVKSTGRVAAITSTAWAIQQNNRKATEFHSFVEKVGGFIDQVPAGTFKSSGTMVPTQIVVIEGANLPWYQMERQEVQDTEGEEELAVADSPSP